MGKKRSSKGRERRYLPIHYPGQAEVRVSETDDGKPKIEGTAAVYDQWSEPIPDWLGYFREIIRPGAFSDVLENDVRALFNHDKNFVLGRTSAGTLELRETEEALDYTIYPPESNTIQDLVLQPLQRGDVDQSSFSFHVKSDNWFTEGGEDRREIFKYSRLFDVGPVTFAAYPQTESQAREMPDGMGLDFEALSNVMFKIKRGLELTAADRDLINSSVQVLRSYLPENEEHEAEQVLLEERYLELEELEI